MPRISVDLPDDPVALAERLPNLTPRMVTVLTGAATLAREAAAPAVSTADLLRAMLAEGGNLGVRILKVLDVSPECPAVTEPATGDAANGLSFSAPAVAALELTFREAITLGHNYVGAEHLLIGLAAEPAGAAGEALRARGADADAVRRAVVAALAGFAHLRAAEPPEAEALQAAVRAALAPVLERIDRLESRSR